MTPRKLRTEELERLSPEAFEAAVKAPFVLVLDNVRSALNVGSAFRTADAFRLEKVVLCGITARPPHKEINKTALGATDAVGWEYFAETSAALSALVAAGYQIVAVEQTTGSVPLQDFRPDAAARYAFVFGHEVFGVGDEAVRQAHVCLEIPQFGTKHSFNVSVSVGIVLWEALRQRGLPA